MHENDFGKRLEQAIEHLTEEQRAGILARAPEAKGLKAALAEVVGLPSQSVLSDMLAARVPGTKYRPLLAAELAVDPAWLEGGGSAAPDWALSPVTAWCRFARQLQAAAQRALVRHDESTLALPGGSHRERLEAQTLARELGYDARDPAILDLVKGRFAAPPPELLWRYAAKLGLAKPLHAAHLERGRELWCACEEEFARQLQQRDQVFRRLLPPAPLFRLMRSALATLRQSQRYQGEDCRSVEDAIELLWAQRWFLGNLPRSQVPSGLSNETGRTRWSRLREIQARYAADTDYEGRQLPGQSPRT